MAVTATPIFPQLIKDSVVNIVNADAQAQKTIAAAGAQGSKIDSLIVTSTDTSARDVSFYRTISGTSYLLGTVSIPANSGNTNALPSIDVLRSAQIPGLSYDSNGNRCLLIGSGTTLTCVSLVSVTAAKTITVQAQQGDF